MTICEATIWRVKLGLKKPYKISVYTFNHFEALLVHLRDDDGRHGWGESILREGYNHETTNSAEALLHALARQCMEKSVEESVELVLQHATSEPYGCAGMIAALEMLGRDSSLASGRAACVPLLVPVQSMERGDIQHEVEKLLREGFRTLKVKVGFGVDEDLARVEIIRRVCAGRATIRLDANNAYGPEEGRRFASQLDPEGVELLEQPCAANDWRANEEVARSSTVPVMLDEPIWLPGDVERASKLHNVAYAKIKLKKAPGVQRLRAMLTCMRECGLIPVLGDGVATGLGNWMEACVARDHVDSAGEMNGFLKLARPVLKQDPTFRDGSVELMSGYWPEVDEEALRSAEHRQVRFRSKSFHPAPVLDPVSG